MPGGLSVPETGGVGGKPLAVLARADEAADLPRLGGMARPDGVVIVSERFWAFAGVDGTLREGDMPRVTGRLGRLPLLRGLARLGASLSPLFRGGGVAPGKERLFLAVAMLAPIGLVFAPHIYGLIGGFAVTAVLVAWLLRGGTPLTVGRERG